MKFSVGMAVYLDFNRLWFTVQSLIEYHWEWLNEIIVVDNGPEDHSESQKIRNFCVGWQGRRCPVRYVKLPDKVGTAPPRNEVFRQSNSEVTICIDSHVLLEKEFFPNLNSFFEKNPTFDGLLTGPMIMDDLAHKSIIFDLIWRSGMWGVWAAMWESPSGAHYITRESPKGFLTLLRYENGESVIEIPEGLPAKVAWPRHEVVLESLNWRRLGYSDSDVFDIPAQGLGMFGCRTDSWLGFNDHFRGFGGEEGYIHEKYRQAGKKVISLGGLGWIHQFRDTSETPPYPAWLHHKIRNYVIGFQEIGRSLDSIYDHFVSRGQYKEQEWHYLLEDPIGRVNPLGYSDKPKVALPMPSIEDAANLEALFLWACKTPRDTHDHLPTFKRLVESVDSAVVVEISKRRETGIGWAAGRPAHLISFLTEHDPLSDLARLTAGAAGVKWDVIRVPESPESVPECDILFIDSRHTKDQLLRELRNFGKGVRKHIVLHDTEIYCYRGENGGPGLCPAIAEWLKDNPEWFVLEHHRNLYGLSVLSRVAELRPSQIVHIWPPGKGPGTELTRILKEIGISEKPNCTCAEFARNMDRLGVIGCETNFDMLVEELRRNADRWGYSGIGSLLTGRKNDDQLTLLEKWKVAWKTLLSGKALKINPNDPLPGLLRMAIEAARRKEGV